MTTGESASPALVLGPMLRYVGETEATIWVETDRECLVEILGRGAPTFEVAGHHYALVVIDGLAPGSEHEYQVALDGTTRWPPPGGDYPPSVLRTLAADRPARLAFGSCRVTEIAAKNLGRPARRERTRQRTTGQQITEQPGSRQQATGQQGTGQQGADALAAYAGLLAGTPHERWPDVLLMIGDQVYADDPGPATRRFIAGHRASRPDLSAPPREVADYEEYCALYREAWSALAVRWLFSVVPTAMIFDDHDVHDDWNISGPWRRDYTAKPWWGERIESAYQSYWAYQHLGNLSPEELARDETWGKVREQGDAARVLADLAHRADRRAPGIRWSFARTFRTTGQTAGNPTGQTVDNPTGNPADNTTGQTADNTAGNPTGGTDGSAEDAISRSAAGDIVRVVLLDSRSRRVVDGTRLMADDEEWRWLTEAVTGDFAHVVLATSVPPLLPRGIHALEAWSERVCGGAWGGRAARFCERLRQAIDLEHWPSFGASFARLEDLLTSLATGRLSPSGVPPATITIISGDVHHSYLTAVDLPPGAASTSASTSAPTAPAAGPSAVYQAVCSPFHQSMSPTMRGAQRLASTRAGGLVGTAVAALAGARQPKLRWRITDGPWFDDMIATLTYAGTAASVRFDQAVAVAVAVTSQAGNGNGNSDSNGLAPVLETDLN